MENFTMIFGETLREQRLLLELSQRMVSEKSGLTIEAIRHMERGRRGPTFANAIKLIVYGMGMTLDDFLIALEEKGITKKEIDIKKIN